MTSWKLFIAAAILATACISSGLFSVAYLLLLLSNNVFSCILPPLFPLSSPVYSACTQNDIRLQAGPTKRQGRVEICRNNQWGTVCHDLWGTADARVVCNQLNYDAAGKCENPNKFPLYSAGIAADLHVQLQLMHHC